MRHLPLLLTLALLAASCGGGEQRAATTPDRRAADDPTAPVAGEPPPGSPLAIPRRVPRRATGAAPPGAERVVRRWAAAVRHADFARAADLLTVPALVQYASPVVRLPTRALVIGWNASLPCGATVSHVAGANGFAIVDFRLTRRPGADCGTGVGATARGAILVRDGHIAEWYRLPDLPRDERPGLDLESSPEV
jgi:hypothetical protein